MVKKRLAFYKLVEFHLKDELLCWEQNGIIIPIIVLKLPKKNFIALTIGNCRREVRLISQWPALLVSTHTVVL